MSELHGWNPDELEKIYLVSRMVEHGEIEAEKAAVKLAGILGNRARSNAVYFSMYAHMVHGRVFREAEDGGVVIYFLRKIAAEGGEDALLRALGAVYGYTGFKSGVGYDMRELENACAGVEREFGLVKKE